MTNLRKNTLRHYANQTTSPLQPLHLGPNFTSTFTVSYCPFSIASFSVLNNCESGGSHFQPEEGNTTLNFTKVRLSLYSVAAPQQRRCEL